MKEFYKWFYEVSGLDKGKIFKKFYKCFYEVSGLDKERVSRKFTSVFIKCLAWTRKELFLTESIGHWDWFKSMKGLGFEENYVEE